MPKSTFEMGLCDDKNCGGFIQYDKINDYMYCMSCHKTWGIVTGKQIGRAHV